MNEIKKEPLTITGGLLSRPCLVIAAFMASVAFLATLFSCLRMLDGGFQRELIQNMIQKGILDRSAQRTWFLLDLALRLLGLSLTVLLAAILFGVLRELRTSLDRPLAFRILGTLTCGARILIILEYCISAIFLLLFVKRVALYARACFDVRGGGYSFFTMLAVEICCVLALIGAGIWFHHFMHGLIDLVASLQRAFLSGIPRGRAITPFCNRSIFSFSILWLLVGLFRIPDWVGAFSAFAFSCSLFFCYLLLHHLKNQMEWMEYVNSKEKNEKN